MNVNLTGIGSLLGASNQKSTINDLVTGDNLDVTNALNGLLQKNESGLSKTQTSTLSNLENYVNDNVNGADAEKLLASISALRSFMELGTEDKSKLDPVFSLLSNNPSLIESDTGSLLNKLI